MSLTDDKSAAVTKPGRYEIRSKIVKSEWVNATKNWRGFIAASGNVVDARTAVFSSDVKGRIRQID